ncbi:MAG TPA: MFS transporter [Kiritimatiellia bacterium]|nr:MFS transporter [Kiritimatiellia bacterium]HMP33481.1 MFS transporter [Kiritimatiellia bacterium]
MYAAYYMCRYNFRFATPGMQAEFGFTTTQISDMLAIWSLTYGTGQLVNGLLTDKIGGKRSMQIGAFGTIIVNLMLGLLPLLTIGGALAASAKVLGVDGVDPAFVAIATIWLINGWFQSFGAPGMVKINAAWFRRTERGTFAGIFGFMIQLGQVLSAKLSRAILAGFAIGGLAIAQGEWRWLFILPPAVTLVAAIFMSWAAKPSPDEAGYPGVIEDELDNSEGVTVTLKESFKTIFTHPLVWFYACAYACTGAVRTSSDQLSILYFQEQLGMDMKKNIPATVAWTLAIMPMAAVVGSLASGWISDKFFKGHRSPVAMCLYFLEAVVIGFAAVLLLKGLVGPTPAGILTGCGILIMIALTANSTHSIVGAAAPMDIGGKKMAGFAAGVIDSFQYYGGAISLIVTGRVLDATKAEHGWLFWYVIMAGFGILGGVAMFLVMQKQKRMKAAAAA